MEQQKDQLEQLREIIAQCDATITEALKTRMECIKEIIAYKRENGVPVLQSGQEKKQLDAVKRNTKDSVFRHEILHISKGSSKTANGYRQKNFLIKTSCSLALWELERQRFLLALAICLLWRS